jgi:K+-sensing histidine kinase KdpD
VGLSALALALMVLMRPLMEHSVFFLFLAAVAISALYGGLGPGLVATALSTVACDFFFLPANGVPLSGPEEALRLTVFLSTGVKSASSPRAPKGPRIACASATGTWSDGRPNARCWKSG